MLTRREAELTQSGISFINKELLKSFGNQSLDSIKGQRKRPDYKKLVDRYVAELLRGVDTIPVNSDLTSTPAADRLQSYFSSLEPPETQESNSCKLFDICNMIKQGSQEIAY